jgi:hypothetical protein
VHEEPLTSSTRQWGSHNPAPVHRLTSTYVYTSHMKISVTFGSPGTSERVCVRIWWVACMRRVRVHVSASTRNQFATESYQWRLRFARTDGRVCAEKTNSSWYIKRPAR